MGRLSKMISLLDNILQKAQNSDIDESTTKDLEQIHNRDKMIKHILKAKKVIKTNQKDNVLKAKIVLDRVHIQIVQTKKEISLQEQKVTNMKNRLKELKANLHNKKSKKETAKIIADMEKADRLLPTEEKKLAKLKKSLEPLQKELTHQINILNKEEEPIPKGYVDEVKK